MKLLLTSGGITNDLLAEALVELVGKPFAQANLLFVSTAANTFGDDKRWIIETLNAFDRLGFRSIDIMDIASLEEKSWRPRFEEADVICFGGGNELYLSRILDRPDIKEYLRFFPEDKVYMGISAGSMVMGNLISDDLYSVLFPEETFADEGVRGLGLFDFCILPHLDSDYFSRLRVEELERLKGQIQKPAYALDDQSALRIVGDKIDIVGGGHSWINT